MTSLHFENVAQTAQSLFQVSRGLFWSYLPIAFLLAILVIYVSGDISGQRFEGLFRRLIIAIILLVGFPQISAVIQGVETNLIAAFGGDQSLSVIFGKVSMKAKELKDTGIFSWLKVGEAGLSLIATISFLVLAVIQHFLDILHLMVWNLLHILGPLALLACLFPTLSNIPKGIFAGMLELALWKPMWILLARLLIAIGFGEQPSDAAHWFDTAIMNFAVAGLMASTPALVHGFLSGSLASIGGSTVQSMLAGTGAVLSQAPMQFIQGATGAAKAQTIGRAGRAIKNRFRAATKFRSRSPTHAPASGASQPHRSHSK